MPPTLALSVWLVLLVALWRFDPAQGPRPSPALLVPLTWMLIAGSRLPSQWLGGQVERAAEALQNGNPLDRSVDLLVMFLAIGILTARSFNWSRFFTDNLALTAFLGFALLSVLWSDFPFITFKHWFRDLGSYLTMLVVLTDAYPLEAVRTLFRRFCYVLVPLSVILNKYFPGISKQYDPWTGQGYYVGATTSKNMLGALCLVSGLFFFWDTVTRWADRHNRQTKRIILVNLVFMAMTAWQLKVSESATSKICLVLGCGVIAATRFGAIRRRPALLKALVPGMIGAYLIATFVFGLDLKAVLAEAVGRNPTLTDRTAIWAFLLSMHTNPLLGTGYQSFWLGSRLEWIWLHGGLGHINEAHNGYLSIYLDLGGIGLALLATFLLAGYRNIWRRVKPFSPLGSLSLAVWTVLLFYNVTEAAFEGGLLWMMLLPGVLAVSKPRKRGAISNDLRRGATTAEEFAIPVRQ